jgi:predicted ATP-grasp superfamily ATP-dependent carboligase
MNILIFPSGSMVAKEIYDALIYEKNIEIYGTDYDTNNLSSFLFKNYIPGCPFIKDKNETITFLNNIVTLYNIKYIFPAFDNIMLFLKENEKEINAKIIGPNIEVINICNSKLLTYKLLENTILTPKIYNNNITDINSIKYPLYSKPIIGYGSRNHKIINNINDLLSVDTDNSLILEYLPGKEYTVDCISGNGKVLYCNARERIKTLNGMSIQSKTVKLDNIDLIAVKIQEKVNFIGAWFFQVKYDDNNNLKLLEIACRIPGAMCVNRVKGVNFPLLSILVHENKSIEPILFNNIDVECYKIYNNYYKTDIVFDTVYCDLDDTLIINNKINLLLIQFLYKCINNNIKLYLITRNAEPSIILEKYKINLFDKIIKLPKNHLILKSTYISEINSIFIDDSYVERLDVKLNKNILCFSPSEIELLL